MKAVYVRWRDSMRTTGWRTVEEADGEIGRPLDAETVGYLVAESDTAVMVALSHQQIDGMAEMVGETITIPKEAVVERAEMRRR